MAKIVIAPDPTNAGELLDKNLGAEYLGGASVRGWSKISTYMICDRMYFHESVQKLRPRKASPALDIGVLFHACMAAHYTTAGKDTYQPLIALQAERPELVAEVKRLLDAYFALYAKEELDTWDVRAVENEILGSMSYGGVTGPVSGRCDLVIAKKQPGDAPQPYGPAKDGVYIVDHKVYSRMTQDLTDGYSMDGQFLLMAHIWRQQKLELVYGKLNGFIINIITKVKVPECKRLHININDADVDRFVETMSPVVAEMQLRINQPGVNDVNTWPMNFAVCKNPRGYGLCKFWNLCQSHGKLSELYEIATWTKPGAK